MCGKKFPTVSIECNQSNAFVWIATFPGEPGTVFEGGNFKVKFDFSGGYPHRHPKINVITPMYNHKLENKAGPEFGSICVADLEKEWKPVKNMAKNILPMMKQILFFPDN